MKRAMSSGSFQENIDSIVEHLLKDQDYLLSKEIRQKVEELNMLLVRARSQKLKVEFDFSEARMKSGGMVSLMDVSVFKQI